MFFILTASILRAFSDAKTLHGGVKELGKSLGVDAVATNPGSCHVVGVWWGVHGGWWGVWSLRKEEGEKLAMGWLEWDGGEGRRVLLL
jgi:hypothetical protein